MQQKNIVVGDLLATYRQQTGSGNPVLLLHGWGDSAETFQQLIAALPRHCSVIAVNLPGFGGSQNPSKPWNVSDYADFVKSFLDKLTIAELTAVIGHSNGGAIAVRLLANHPKISRKLVLIAAAGIRSTADQRLHRQAFKLLAKSGRVMTRPLGVRIQTRLKTQLYKKAGSDYLLLPHMQETFKKIVAEDVREAAKKLTQQTQLIWGQNDESTPVFMAQAYADLIQHATLHIFPDADHFVHQQEAGPVARLIGDFIS